MDKKDYKISVYDEPLHPPVNRHYVRYQQRDVTTERTLSLRAALLAVAPSAFK
jgi:hypothetical protein